MERTNLQDLSPEQPQRRKKITAKYLHAKNLNCGKCRFAEVDEENEEKVLMCTASYPAVVGVPSARGARATDKLCGMAGKMFRPIPDKTDETAAPELTRQQKAAITKAKNKAANSASPGAGS